MGDNEETISALLQEAKRLYDEEDLRFRYAEQKAGALLTAAGVLLTLFARAPVENGGSSLLTDCRLILLIGTISSLAIAFAFGMAALLPRHEFERTKPEDLAEKAKASPLLVELNKELIALFAAATSKNKIATDKKLSSVTSGIYAVSVSLFLIALRAIVEALY